MSGAAPSVPDPLALVDDTKRALRRLAKSVVVITSRHDGRRHAMAATAVDALSMDPPSILACVNRSASLHPVLAVSEHFAVNILGRDQEQISHHCGGKTRGEDRFGFGNWDDSGPVPIMTDAQAVILCISDARFDYGTHSIFIGRVVGAQTQGEVDPLIYVDGRYTGLSDANVHGGNP